ncbi:MAG TPA: B12-binding domain-containing radical SAM protein [Ignavibacteriaceae bacterium]|nr:B12-binding domain-containing radical SAM protein [Ignavibacteriaceae bacterium]
MKILLVYPETPTSFWSFKDALKFVAKKVAEPPLGLITVAASLPKEWEKKLIDMNISNLENKHIIWADYVFLSGMNIQIKSFKEVIRRCNTLSTKIVVGGPLATTQHKDFPGVDHFILNEAENTLPPFLEDLKKGNPKHVYSSEEFPDITRSPTPLWELLEIKRYASLSLQYSRGCPYDCDFCSITMLNGRTPRTKTSSQFIHELETIYGLGYRGPISIVDDNFIGNKRKLKEETLPLLIEWSKQKKYPFSFITEVSINLADDTELMDKMISAGFNSIFVGIETPSADGLLECGKSQNLKRNLVSSVKILQQKGFIVSGGFIVGFDTDSSAIFQNQIDFIQDSGIVSAMVGLLNAPSGTKLFKKMQSENRLLDVFSGNNMDGYMNFIPKMNYQELIGGYSRIIKTIYAQKEYYLRVKHFLNNYKLPVWNKNKIKLKEVRAFMMLVWLLGTLEKGKKYFWKLFAFSLFRHPNKFPLAMTLAVYGYHFRKIAARI